MVRAGGGCRSGRLRDTPYWKPSYKENIEADRCRNKAESRGLPLENLRRLPLLTKSSSTSLIYTLKRK